MYKGVNIEWWPRHVQILMAGRVEPQQQTEAKQPINAIRSRSPQTQQTTTKT
uniref:Uncharacterized protein n=1 Tax=Rhizophora mucronata TaxID=61149 RepID=A0A2P2JU69_RHIMU